MCSRGSALRSGIWAIASVADLICYSLLRQLPRVMTLEQPVRVIEKINSSLTECKRIEAIQLTPAVKDPHRREINAARRNYAGEAVFHSGLSYCFQRCRILQAIDRAGSSIVLAA